MNALDTVRQQARREADQVRNEKPNQYLRLMEPVIEGLRETRAGLRSAAKLRVELERVLEKHLPSAHDPKPIAKIIADIRSLAGGALETINKADDIEDMIEKFTNVGPTYFNFQSVQTAIAIDTRDARPLIDSHKGLESVMGEIEKLEATLKVAVSQALKDQPAPDEPPATPPVKARIPKPRS